MRFQPPTTRATARRTASSRGDASLSSTAPASAVQTAATPALPRFRFADIAITRPPDSVVQRKIAFQEQRTVQSLAAELQQSHTKKGLSAKALQNAIEKALTALDNEDTNYSEQQAKDKVIADLKLQPKTESKEKSERKDLATQDRSDFIQPYLALLDHLGGELKDDSKVTGGLQGKLKAGIEVKGGHLWTEMQKKFGKNLKLVKGEPDPNGVWECEWKAGDGGTPKASTMFPSGWTKEDLRAQLMGATRVSNNITLKCGIPIKKAGDTFYPLMS